MHYLYESEHLRERNFFAQLDQPGVGRLNLPGMPSRYGSIPWALRLPAPRLGEHSEEVFCGQLGMSKVRLNELRQAGIAEGDL
jgi:crotonobetainyl-CoA:carnitine CoA-transferase CaiB-like acyl-CoA transferase